MATLYRYSRTVTPGPNGTVARHDPGDPPVVTELTTLGGYTYVSLAEGEALPPQPAGLTVESVTPGEDLIAQLRAESPVIRRIDEHVIGLIREQYTIDQELYYARISVGALMQTYALEPAEQDLLVAYQQHVETARAWGRAARARYGV